MTSLLRKYYRWPTPVTVGGSGDSLVFYTKVVCEKTLDEKKNIPLDSWIFLEGFYRGILSKDYWERETVEVIGD